CMLFQGLSLARKRKRNIKKRNTKGGADDTLKSSSAMPFIASAAGHSLQEIRFGRRCAGCDASACCPSGSSGPEHAATSIFRGAEARDVRVRQKQSDQRS